MHCRQLEEVWLASHWLYSHPSLPNSAAAQARKTTAIAVTFVARQSSELSATVKRAGSDVRPCSVSKHAMHCGDAASQAVTAAAQAAGVGEPVGGGGGGDGGAEDVAVGEAVAIATRTTAIIIMTMVMLFRWGGPQHRVLCAGGRGGLMLSCLGWGIDAFVVLREGGIDRVDGWVFSGAKRGVSPTEAPKHAFPALGPPSTPSVSTNPHELLWTREKKGGKEPILKDPLWAWRASRGQQRVRPRSNPRTMQRAPR